MRIRRYHFYRFGMLVVGKVHRRLNRFGRDEAYPVHVRLLAFQWAHLIFALHTMLFDAARREFTRMGV